MNTVGTTYDQAMALDYEDLVTRVTNDAPKAGLPTFSTEDLLRDAEFIIHQIRTYEDAADDDEVNIMEAPCLRQLISYAGLKGDYSRKDESYKAARRHIADARHGKSKPIVSFSKATTTPLVAHVFKKFFLHQITHDRRNDKNADAKCGVCEACMRRDCGRCNGCKRMAKYGGDGPGKKVNTNT
jgi:DNA (cytosine-5)-methyltransferase 1